MPEPVIDKRVRRLWARTRLRVWPEAYYLVSLPTVSVADAAQLVAAAAGTFAGLVLERDEVSLTVPEELWVSDALRPIAQSEAGPFRVITLDQDLALDVSGYLAPAAALLAEVEVPIVPQCGFLKDHLLVHEHDLDRAVGVLEGLVGRCRG